MDAFEMVQQDLLAGLAGVFESVDQADPATAIVPIDDFDGAEPLTNGTTTAVPWRFRAMHRGEIFGLASTGRRIDIHGVTLVSEPDADSLAASAADPDDSGHRFHRFIDWAGVMAQLGVTPGRAHTGDVEEI